MKWSIATATALFAGFCAMVAFDAARAADASKAPSNTHKPADLDTASKVAFIKKSPNHHPHSSTSDNVSLGTTTTLAPGLAVPDGFQLEFDGADTMMLSKDGSVHWPQPSGSGNEKPLAVTVTWPWSAGREYLVDFEVMSGAESFSIQTPAGPIVMSAVNGHLQIVYSGQPPSGSRASVVASIAPGQGSLNQEWLFYQVQITPIN